MIVFLPAITPHKKQNRAREQLHQCERQYSTPECCTLASIYKFIKSTGSLRLIAYLDVFCFLKTIFDKAIDAESRHSKEFQDVSVCDLCDISRIHKDLEIIRYNLLKFKDNSQKFMHCDV